MLTSALIFCIQFRVNYILYSRCDSIMLEVKETTMFKIFYPANAATLLLTAAFMMFCQGRSGDDVIFMYWLSVVSTWMTVTRWAETSQVAVTQLSMLSNYPHRLYLGYWQWTYPWKMCYRWKLYFLKHFPFLSLSFNQCCRRVVRWNTWTG